MRWTRLSGMKLASGLVLVALTMSTGCKTGGWGASSWAWNPMKWGSSPPAASSLASTSKPSTQVPTPGPTSSVAARNATGGNATGTPSATQGYGGTTAPSTALAGYPAGGYPTTPNVNGYPTQPAAAYGAQGQPGQVAPTGGYATGPYGMTATPAGSAAAQPGSYPTYTASAQPSSYQSQPYQSQQYQAQPYQSYQAQPYQTQPAQQPAYAPPAYNTTPAANDASGYQNNPYVPAATTAPPAGYAPAAQPNNGGINTGGFIQGGASTSSNNAPAMPWQTQETGAAPAAAGYAAANPSGPYDAAHAAGTTAPAAGEYATAYNTAAQETPRGNVAVSGVTTGSPAPGLPASLNTAGGYRPGSTGRPLDSGVQNAGYQTPTGYSNGNTLYR